MAWSVECNVCKKRDKFGDAKDIQFARWRIIAWNVKNGEPLVVCPECEYGKPKEK